jgi:hypothetical protein
MTQLPLLIKELIEWYIWKAKIKECNQEYHLYYKLELCKFTGNQQVVWKEPVPEKLLLVHPLFSKPTLRYNYRNISFTAGFYVQDIRNLRFLTAGRPCIPIFRLPNRYRFFSDIYNQQKGRFLYFRDVYDPETGRHQRTIME